MKRAAVQWGIGRYLYNLEEGWADVHPGGNYSGKTPDNKWFKWSPPQLPKWAVPEGDVPKKYHVPEKEEPTEAGQLSPRQVAINRLAGLVETWSEKGKADMRERVPRLDLQGLYDLIADIEQDIVRDDML